MRIGRGQFLSIACSALALHAGLAASMFWAASLDRGVPIAHTSDDWHIVPFEPLPKPPPPPQPPPEAPRLPPVEEVFGEQHGTGEAISSVDSPDVAQAPQVHEFEQAWTRRQPTVAPPSTPASPPPPPVPTPDATADALVESASSPPTPTIDMPFGALPTPPEPGPPEPAPQPSDPKPVANQKSAADQQPQPEQHPTRDPRSDSSAANSTQAEPSPAPQAQSDFDAFAKQEGVDFTRGGMHAREGREVHFARPQIDLRFMTDATAIWGRGISVKLQIDTDAAGKPLNVKVIETSGSDQIDNAVRLAAFNSWFGAPMSDHFEFTVRFVK